MWLTGEGAACTLLSVWIQSLGSDFVSHHFVFWLDFGQLWGDTYLYPNIYICPHTINIGIDIDTDTGTDTDIDIERGYIFPAASTDLLSRMPGYSCEFPGSNTD